MFPGLSIFSEHGKETMFSGLPTFGKHGQETRFPGLSNFGEHNWQTILVYICLNLAKPTSKLSLTCVFVFVVSEFVSSNTAMFFRF